MADDAIMLAFYHIRKAKQWLEVAGMKHRGSNGGYRLTGYAKKLGTMIIDFITLKVADMGEDILSKELKTDPFELDEIGRRCLLRTSAQREFILGVLDGFERGEEIILIDETTPEPIEPLKSLLLPKESVVSMSRKKSKKHFEYLLRENAFNNRLKTI